MAEANDKDDGPRKSDRYNLSSVKARLEDTDSELIDISPTGMLLKCEGAYLERGDVITVMLNMPLMDHIVPLAVDGFVVRVDDRGIAIDYARPTQTWKHVMRILDAKERKKK